MCEGDLVTISLVNGYTPFIGRISYLKDGNAYTDTQYDKVNENSIGIIVNFPLVNHRQDYYVVIMESRLGWFYDYEIEIVK